MFEFEISEDSAVGLLYDEIGEGPYGGVSAESFVRALESIPRDVTTVNLRINSPGGALFEGLAMYNALARHRARIIIDVDGLAASIASVIAMAGSEVRIAETAFLMIHEPFVLTQGGADELRETADLLDKTTTSIISAYRLKTGLSDARIRELLKAESWLTADESVELRFADSKVAALEMAAKWDLTGLANVPESLAAKGGKKNRWREEARQRELQLARVTMYR